MELAAQGERDEAVADAPAPDWVTLFNQPRFHALNLTGADRLVTTTATHESGRVIGSWAGALRHEDDGSATLVNGFSAPFGGLDFLRPRETPENVQAVVDAGLAHFAEQGASIVRAKLPPGCYGENEQLTELTLLNTGFTVERCELDQFVDLRQLDAESYVGHLKSPARRALHHCLGPEWEFRPATTDDEWDRAYSTLAANRAKRGYQLSLSRDYVARARAAMPDRLDMFELFHGEEAVAAALVYRVRPTVNYVVAWGDGLHALERSPMNLLAYRVVEASLSSGVELLDLGTSNDPSARHSTGGLVVDTGLVQFKRSILAQIQPRFTLTRRLGE